MLTTVSHDRILCCINVFIIVVWPGTAQWKTVQQKHVSFDEDHRCLWEVLYVLLH